MEHVTTSDEILQTQSYYPFGLTHSNPSDVQVGLENQYKYNNLEIISDEGLDWILYRWRTSDPTIGRFLQVDPLAETYVYNTPYAIAENRVINGIDLEGLEFYFSAGAGHKDKKVPYVKNILDALEAGGIRNTRDVKTHKDQISDGLFTKGIYSKKAYNKIANDLSFVNEYQTESFYNPEKIDSRITNAQSFIETDMKTTSVEEGSQLNLMGYSTGSVIMAQTALKMANEGTQVDNLILLGSSIKEGSDLDVALQGNENIKNIIRIDIEGDNVISSSAIGIAFSVLKQKENHPHFKYAFGENAVQNQKKLAEKLKEKGVE